MINIAHVYAYYHWYEDLEKALDDGVEFLELSSGETVFSILLSEPKPNYGLVNKCIETILL